MESIGCGWGRSLGPVPFRSNITTNTTQLIFFISGLIMAEKALVSANIKVGNEHGCDAPAFVGMHALLSLSISRISFSLPSFNAHKRIK